MKQIFLKRKKLIYSLIALFIGGSIAGITSFNRNKANEEKIIHQNEAATIFSIKDKKVKVAENSYFLKENPDPATLIFDQFNYNRTEKKAMIPKIQQLEDEVDQLTMVFEKEKEKEESKNNLENLNVNLSSKKEMPIVQPIDPVVKENAEENPPINWKKPQIVLSSSYIVINQYQVFETSDYFKIITGSDPSPKVTHNFIDTSKLGEQNFSIQVTDSAGNTSYNKIKFCINSAPIIELKQPFLHLRIDQPIDLLEGVTAFDLEDGELTSRITFETNLNINKEGLYDVTYTIADQHGAKTKIKAMIKVINDMPVIHVPEAIEHKINHCLDIFDHIKVLDTEDGVIQLSESNIIETNFDFRKEGNYFFKIGNVKDHHGKFAKERSITVRVTNEAPKIISANMQVNVFSLLKKEDYLKEIIVTDREDAKENLKIEIDKFAWEQIDTTKRKEYIIPIKVTDTNGKSTKGYGKIMVINEPPKFIGVVNRELMLGDAFDPLAGISVYDKEETLSLEDVEVTETVNIDKPGTYVVRLKVSDSFEQVFASYQLTIVDNREKEVEED